MSQGNGSTGSSDLDMLIKLLGMTGSSNDNEALVALRLATKWLTQRGHNWDDLLRGKVTVEADPFSLPPTAEPQPAQQWTQPQPRYRSPPPPPPPPPPPRKWDNIANIQAMFDGLEFVSTPHSIQLRLNVIESRFHAQKFLMDPDYQFLVQTHRAYAPPTKRKKRRTR